MSSYGSLPATSERQNLVLSDASHESDDRKSSGTHRANGPYQRSPRYTKRTHGPATLSRRVSHVSISSSHGDGPSPYDIDEIEEENQGGYQMTKRDKRFIVITFSFVNFGLGLFFSLLGPFFPNEAKNKGVTSTAITGLIFGVFELTLVLMSPVYGNFISVIGAKFMYCTGLIVSGCAAILFGFLDRCPDGNVYIIMCFIVRIVEGLGAAGCLTASFAIMARTFPKDVATMFGTLELFTGLGLMVGPPLGGTMYQLGGFLFPFLVSGSLIVIIGFISLFLLPSIGELEPRKNSFVLGLLKIPVVAVMGLYLITGSFAIGFMDVGLSLYLSDVYHFNPLITGLVFLAMPGMYALTAPFWGFVADKIPTKSKFFMVGGYCLSGMGFCLIGPAPFLPIANNHLWLLIIALCMSGLGLATLVITFQVITEGTRESGYPDTLETYGLISGLFNSFFAVGAFAGPLIGGSMIDALGFPMACVACSISQWCMVCVIVSYLIISHCCRKKTQVAVSADESTQLLSSTENC